MRHLDLQIPKKVSRIGLGTWQFGSREWGYGEAYSGHAAYAIVRRALALGVTLFDTAEVYGEGDSERILGRALGQDRESAFIADKIYPLGPGGPLVRRRAMASAGRLGVRRIDLYQAHEPSPVFGDGMLMRGMRALQRSGLVGDVGVSNYPLARWRAAERALGHRVLSNQVRYSLIDRAPEHDLLPFAESTGHAVTACSPLGQGLLSGRYHAATPAQIALAWVIRHPAVAAVAGASSVEQLESNVAAAEIQLADDEYQALQAASAWACGTAAPPASFRRGLPDVRRCARGGRYVARTLWRDSRR